MTFGGINMAVNSCKAYGYEVDEEVIKIFTDYRKTHNQGVFDVYTPDILRCRKSGVLTGLPDGYGRGRIIGDYRRVALYGIDRLIGVGGIAQKSPFVMQLLADTTGMRIDVSDCKQAGAMGAVVHAATIAGLYPSVTEAQQALCAPASRSYVPDVSRKAVLNERYARYRAVGAFTERLKNNR